MIGTKCKFIYLKLLRKNFVIDDFVIARCVFINQNSENL